MSNIKRKSNNKRIICTFCNASLTRAHFSYYGHRHGLCVSKKQTSKRRVQKYFPEQSFDVFDVYNEDSDNEAGVASNHFVETEETTGKYIF